MSGSLNGATSPIVVALLLIVVAVAGGITVYVFLVGGQQAFNTSSSGLNASISVALYSTDAKVGLYGDRANFTVSVGSSLSTPQIFDVNITSNDHEVQGNTYLVLPNQATTIALTQDLNETGIWGVNVTVHGVVVASYYFQVAGSDEANFLVGEWREQQYYRNLTYVCLVLAFTAIVISAASLARKPKTIIQAST